MPGLYRNAFLRELPRLRATEALELATAVMVGTGSGKKEVIRRTVREWERRMRSGEVQRQLELNREQIDKLMAHKGITIEWQSHSEKQS